jgi:lipopolysaccharide/colanic/teichoic acid biosynthesis glycosyltransferase
VDERIAVTLNRSLLAGRAVKLLDVSVASFLILFLLPILMLIVLAIYLEDGAPILFRQPRLAQQGKSFVLYKFRKFRNDVPANGCALTLQNDERFTRVGRRLERTKLDELPQLWNVVRGDMSIVGPRPESLAFADCFNGRYRELLRYRPGIFGPAQALFRNESALYPNGQDPEQFYREVLFPAKADIDLSYYPARSGLGDCAWATRCCLAVLGVAGPWQKTGLPNATPAMAGVEQSLQNRQVG